MKYVIHNRIGGPNKLLNELVATDKEETISAVEGVLRKYNYPQGFTGHVPEVGITILEWS